MQEGEILNSSFATSHYSMKRRTKKVILIVEDSRLLQQVLVQRATVQMGAECIIDDSGENCLRLCAERNPDLVILDMGLPKISGLSLLRQIRQGEGTSHIPVIAYSAYSFKELVEECSDIGVQSYVSKSEPISNLFKEIRKLLQL